MWYKLTMTNNDCFRKWSKHKTLVEKVIILMYRGKLNT